MAHLGLKGKTCLTVNVLSRISIPGLRYNHTNVFCKRGCQTVFLVHVVFLFSLEWSFLIVVYNKSLIVFFLQPIVFPTTQAPASSSLTVQEWFLIGAAIYLGAVILLIILVQCLKVCTIA